MDITLQIGVAAAKPLADFGLSAAVLTQNHQAADTLSLTVPQRYEAAPLIAPFTRCILRVDGVVRFVGWCDEEPAQVAGNAEAMSYTLRGPWRLLERAPYRAAAKIGGTLVPASSGRLTLGGEATVGGWVQRTVRAQVIALLNSVALDYVMPDGLMDFQHPQEDRVDDYPGILLRALLGFAPGTVLWWTYSGTTPVLNFGDSGTMSITRTLTATDLMAAPISPLYSALVRNVSVVYLSDVGGVAARAVQDIPAAGDGLAYGSDRDALYTFQIGSQPVPGIAFASALAAWAQRLHVAASPSFLGLSWDRHPGEQWGFGGKFSRLAGKRTTCQQIVRDLFRHTESLTLGPPPAPAFLSKRVTGSNGDSSSGGDDPSGSVSITVAAAGGGLDTSKATWSVGERGGAGNGSADLPPGSYVVVFHPAYDTDSHKLFFAPSVPVTVTDGGSTSASGTYEPLSQLVLASAGHTLDISSTDIQLFQEGTDEGFFASDNGWMQLKNGSKQVYLDATDVPDDDTVKALAGSNNYASLTATEDCEE